MLHYFDGTLSRVPVTLAVFGFYFVETWMLKDRRDPSCFLNTNNNTPSSIFRFVCVSLEKGQKCPSASLFQDVRQASSLSCSDNILQFFCLFFFSLFCQICFFTSVSRFTSESSPVSLQQDCFSGMKNAFLIRAPLCLLIDVSVFPPRPSAEEHYPHTGIFICDSILNNVYLFFFYTTLNVNNIKCLFL